MDKSCNVSIMDIILLTVISVHFDEDDLWEDEDWEDDEWEDDDDDW